MKKLFLILTCAFAITTTACADTDKPINESQLPTAARQFIKKHFPSSKIAMAKLETGLLSKEYDVIFTNGDKLEFDSKGAWTEVSCKNTVVPAAVVPAAIAKHVSANYPEQTIKRIEKEGNNYEVKLSDKWEITFNSKYQVIDIDD